MKSYVKKEEFKSLLEDNETSNSLDYFAITKSVHLCFSLTSDRPKGSFLGVQIIQLQRRKDKRMREKKSCYLHRVVEGIRIVVSLLTCQDRAKG